MAPLVFSPVQSFAGFFSTESRWNYKGRRHLKWDPGGSFAGARHTPPALQLEYTLLQEHQGFSVETAAKMESSLHFSSGSHANCLVLLEQQSSLHCGLQALSYQSPAAYRALGNRFGWSWHQVTDRWFAPFTCPSCSTGVGPEKAPTHAAKKVLHPCLPPTSQRIFLYLKVVGE